MSVEKTVPTRILIADDHDIVRQGICAIIARHHGLEVCGEAADGREAIAKARDLKPDIIVIDIAMPMLNGLAATKQITREFPGIKVLVLSMYDSEQVVHDVLEAGAFGYLLKSDAARDLIAALDALQHDRPFFTNKVSEMVLELFLRRPAGFEGKERALTSREREVIQLVAEGKTTKQIAESLGLSAKTADKHRANLMRKLKVHSVSELVLYAIRNNIVRVGAHLPRAATD
jgi:DNA-binding NarL/FixJ family response regulator